MLRITKVNYSLCISFRHILCVSGLKFNSFFLSFSSDVALWLRADRHYHGVLRHQNHLPRQQEEGGFPQTGGCNKRQRERQRCPAHHTAHQRKGKLWEEVMAEFTLLFVQLSVPYLNVWGCDLFIIVGVQQNKNLICGQFWKKRFDVSFLQFIQ